MREIIILGSTGSIGVQALEIVAANPEKFKVVALSAGSSRIELLVEQARKFGVQVIGTTAAGAKVRALAGEIQVIDGNDAASEIATIPCDIVLNAITGSIGLGPTLAALGVGNKVALANKESLVAGGELVMKFGRDPLIPVDSEHSALYQCFLSGKQSEVKQVILTASGGPFRNRDDLTGVTLSQALAHPTWMMGPSVTINSATLMNKGLEIIEAHYLFDLPYSKISAVIHPQSVVHSMVEFVDGSTIAQASPPNMKGPIAYALNEGNRISNATAPIDWSQSHDWSFAPIDNERFPAVDLARRCGELGGGVPTIFNAANEIAVAAFIAGKIGFTKIIDTVEEVLLNMGGDAPITIRDISDVSAIEHAAQIKAKEILER